MIGTDIIAALSSSLGEEKARAAVEEACRGLGVDQVTMTRDEALDVLENIAQTPGVVGVCARFCRSRFILRWASRDLSTVFAGPCRSNTD